MRVIQNRADKKLKRNSLQIYHVRLIRTVFRSHLDWSKFLCYRVGRVLVSAWLYERCCDFVRATSCMHAILICLSSLHFAGVGDYLVVLLCSSSLKSRHISISTLPYRECRPYME